MSDSTITTEQKLFKPSKYQQDVFDALMEKGSDLQVNAVAGSGKTTTLLQALNRIPLDTVANSLMVAFSRTIVEDLKKKAPPGVDVRTSHSLGMATVGSYFTRIQGRKFETTVRDTKYKSLITSYWIGNYRSADEPPGDDERQMFHLVHFTRVTLTNPNDRDAVMEMALERDIELPQPERMLDALPRILAAGADVLCKEKHPGFAQPIRPDQIDYDDQIWLPFALDLSPKKFSLVMVDEAQDLNAAQLDLLLKCRADGGQMLFVGDPRQAIYAFCGADADSWQNIAAKTAARQLPLSVCYRCPTSVIELAKTIVPEIEAAPDAPAGKVEDISTEQFMRDVSSKDMVLCRVNAPLITTAFKLITDGKPARVRGREIGRSLTRIIDNIEKQCKSNGTELDFEQFLTYTQVYRDVHDSILRKKKDNEMQISNLHDQVDSLEAVYINVVSNGGTSVEDLHKKLVSLFTDEENGHILLTSIHRAKGLEAERVFLLRPDKLPHPMATTPSALQQEENLRYVAVTRALKELFIVRPEGKKAEPAAQPAALPEVTEPVLTKQIAEPIAVEATTLKEEEPVVIGTGTVAPSPSLLPAIISDDPDLERLLTLHAGYCDLQLRLMHALVTTATRTGEYRRLSDALAQSRRDMRKHMDKMREIIKKG